MSQSHERYVPIEDHGAIGNLRTSALVARDGTIDWCCFPRADSGSIFASILDADRGGRFRICPLGGGRGDQAYVPGTNILETSWGTTTGRVTLTDFMPLRGSILGACDPPSVPEIFRVIRCEGEPCTIALEWSPRFDYGRARMTLELRNGGAVAAGGRERAVLDGLPADARIDDDGFGPVLRATFRITPGQDVPVVTWYGEGEPPFDLQRWKKALDLTTRAWLDWTDERDQSASRDFAGKWQPLVDRSALALKLLTYPTNGAIIAASTTSLPEDIGGVRNWDYRYTWVRDASFTAQALVAIGHRAEALDFLEWIERIAMEDEREGDELLHLMYTIDGDTRIPESTLDHLSGYRDSRPVRIGNGAASQFQLDIYGELVGAAYEMFRLGRKVDGGLWKFLSRVTDKACDLWREPDWGIWEVRSEPRHFVYSKLMVWVACDRALRIAKRFGITGNVQRWERTRREVRDAILNEGFDSKVGAFVQSFGSRSLDASSLLIPVVGFLPWDDPRVQGTIDACLEHLTDNGFVYRYRTEEGIDGIAGHEGAFLLTTFWMVDALALSGRLDEARAMFEGVASRANHVGLFAEELNPRTGAFLGNFPQAFSHIGCINSALYISHSEGREMPLPEPLGSAGQWTESPAIGD